jgi:uncharacterized protein YjiS (DUF1127 family)
MSRFSRLAERFRVARYTEALNLMTDRQLADIGLTRGGISARAQELARLG